MRALSPGLLIVNQAERTHRQIDELFDKLAPHPQGSVNKNGRPTVRHRLLAAHFNAAT